MGEGGVEIAPLEKWTEQGKSNPVLVHGLLPDGARNSGPGNDGCDGKGIDDLDVCLAMAAP